MPEPRTFTDAYIPRVVDHELDELFGELPAILLDGPKGVGKTATAVRRCRSTRQLDVEAEREVVEADPRIMANDTPPVLVDEWQRVPEVFDAVRRMVDEDPSGGRFLLTGSAPTIQTHSGAGRISTMRMRPLTIFERYDISDGVSFAGLLDGTAHVAGRCEFDLGSYVDEIVAGGFPGLRRLGPRARDRQLDSYIDRIVDHDVPEAGLALRRPATLLAWLRAYAAAVATSTSWEKVRNAATGGTDEKPAKTTTIPYIELLTRLRILDPVDAWMPSNNHLLALTKAPKHYLADPALAVRLVRLSASQLAKGSGPDADVPRDGTYLGGLFESLAVLSVRTFAQNCDARVNHLRTDGGRHEIDVIVEGAQGVVGIEVKLSGSIGSDDVRHLLWLRERLGDRCVDIVVLHTGPEAYRRPDGVAVIPLGLLVP